MNKDTVAILEDMGSARKYSTGTLIFAAGESAREFYFVRGGEIRVYKMDDRGREIEVLRVGPGDFVGEAVVFASESYPVFAEASKDSEVLVLTKESVFEKIGKDRETGRFFLSLLARKCLVLNERIEALGLKTVRERLIQYLLSSCSGMNECLIELNLKKGDLARLLGTISETLSRTLRQMEEEGLIEVQGPRIRVIDCRRMRKDLHS